MSKLGEFVGIHGHKVIAGGTIAITGFAGGFGVGLEVSSAFNRTAAPAVAPAPELVMSTHSDVFSIDAGKFCVGSTVYDVIDGQILPEPNSSCNENTISGSATVDVAH